MVGQCNYNHLDLKTKSYSNVAVLLFALNAGAVLVY